MNKQQLANRIWASANNMRNIAANAGKKAGEFYTPHEVAMIMSEIVAEHHKDKDSLEIYDPTSGSGSLLITIIPQNIVTRCADTLEDDWPIHEDDSEIDKPLAVDAVVINPPYKIYDAEGNEPLHIMTLTSSYKHRNNNLPNWLTPSRAMNLLLRD